MNVELSERAVRIADDLVESGRFASIEDALEYGLMAIEQLDAETDELLADKSNAWWADLNRSIAEAQSDIAAGRGVPVTAELFEEVRREGRARLAAGKLGR